MHTKMRLVELGKQVKVETGSLDFAVMVPGAQDTRLIPWVKSGGKAEGATRLGKAGYISRDVSDSERHNIEDFVCD